MDRRDVLLRRVRWSLIVFMAGLVVSGLTAFPLQYELEAVAAALGIPGSAAPDSFTGLRWWIATVRDGLRETYSRYPFMAYGTDWLAYAHLVIAVAFLGPLRNPVRNVWVIQAGLIACAAVIPLALICGPIRGITLYWRLIDCSFGVLGAVPLGLAWRWTRELARAETSTRS